VQSEEGDGLAKATANTQGRMERALNILNDCKGDERKTVDDGQLLTTDGGLLIHQDMLERSYIARQAVGEPCSRWLASLPGKCLLRC
jgi:hypothetical protein